MKLTNLTAYLAENPYPGRGIVMGRTANNQAVIAYFIMGPAKTAATEFLKTPRTASGQRPSTSPK